MSRSALTTRLLFVRHAQTIWNIEQRYAGSSEVPLSKEAAHQIAKLTTYLSTQSVDVIYSSPLTRCLQTITPTATEHALRIIVRQDLRERKLGEWEGKSEQEIHPTHSGYQYPLSAYNGEFRIPGAETLEELEQRVRQFLNEMREAHPGQTVLVTTHAGIIWTLQSRIVQNRPRKIHWPSNCSITTIITEDGHYLIEGMHEPSIAKQPLILVPTGKA